MLSRRSFLADRARPPPRIWVQGYRRLGPTRPASPIPRSRSAVTMPYSGPASSVMGMIGRADAAYFKMINEMGGVNGRRITLISLDDGYNPSKTVEQVRRLVEQEQVAFIFNSAGTSPNLAIQLLSQRQQGAANLRPQRIQQVRRSLTPFPWTIGCWPSFQTEGHIYAKHIPRDEARRKDRICQPTMRSAKSI